MRVQQTYRPLLFNLQINYQVRSGDRVANLADLFDFRFDEMGERSFFTRYHALLVMHISDALPRMLLSLARQRLANMD